MNYSDLKTRNMASTWLSIFFLILLLTYLGFIEFFKDQRTELSAVDLLKNPIRAEVIHGVDSIRFKNRLGEYRVTTNGDHWSLNYPRVMPAKNQVIENILAALRTIKVTTIHEYEPINLQSFSLDNPIMEIDLYTKLDEKVEIKVGLINPINKTSYISVSDKNYIYQVEILKGKLEKLELSDFIDASIFSMKSDQISELKIYQGKTLLHKLINDDGVWISNKYKTISQDKTIDRIDRLLSMKTHMIIDQQNSELQTFIKNYMDHPLYQVEVHTKDKQTVLYKVSSLIGAITDLKLEKRQYFLMSASDRSYPYVISKEFLKEFLIRYKDLR